MPLIAIVDATLAVAHDAGIGDIDGTVSDRKGRAYMKGSCVS